MEPFIAQIILFGGNFAPRGWALCDGQLLSITQNDALFSILGTTYGGDGRTTFGLPDLRGRAPIGSGNGPGLTSRRIGSKLGSENETLINAQIPSHNHSPLVKVTSDIQRGDATDQPQNAYIAQGGDYSSVSTQNAYLANDAVSSSNIGGSQSHNNMPPVTVLNYIIALVGVYPSRS